MSNQFWLTGAHPKCITPYFPKSRGVPGVDDRCADTFFSAIGIAATVIFWLGT